ncbi:hypothetical protein T484DRAFT_1945472 [Baffinella frigidus]|nr:hypothetical protein T484DRAFT_1945472 [Cryptophyta sp. CCMP2293]
MEWQAPPRGLHTKRGEDRVPSSSSAFAQHLPRAEQQSSRSPQRPGSSVAAGHVGRGRAAMGGWCVLGPRRKGRGRAGRAEQDALAVGAAGVGAATEGRVNLVTEPRAPHREHGSRNAGTPQQPIPTPHPPRAPPARAQARGCSSRLGGAAHGSARRGGQGGRDRDGGLGEEGVASAAVPEGDQWRGPCQARGGRDPQARGGRGRCRCRAVVGGHGAGGRGSGEGGGGGGASGLRWG